MAAERCFLRSDLRLTAAGAVIAASALMTIAPAWSGPVANANVIVDLSVIDTLSADPRPVPPVTTSRASGRTSDLLQPGAAAPMSSLHVGAMATVGGSAVAGRDYGRLIPDWPPRTAAEIRDRTVAPVHLLTRKAAHLLASVEPPPRTPGKSVSAAVPVDNARLFPPPQVLAAAAQSARAPAAGGNAAGSPAETVGLFPPPAPLVMAAAPQAGGSRSVAATPWRPEPTRKPANGLQVALLSPARPPIKPHEDASLRPAPRPKASASVDKRESAGARLQLIYAANGIEIPSPAQPQLESLAREVKAAARLRIQLAAYAGDRTDSASRARRTSLSRALAIRGFLIDHGVAAGRIDVRALGNTSASGEADRVDVVVLDK